MTAGLLRRTHQHYASCREGDSCWPAPRQRIRSVSVFGRSWSPLVIRFYLGHWPEIVALGDAQETEEAVRDLRESLKYEFDHLRPQNVIPCVCRFSGFNPPRAVPGGGGLGGRSFSDIVPSIQSAYEALPLGWTGRTKVWLMMGGFDVIDLPDTVRRDLIGRASEDAVYKLREREPRRESIFDRAHVQRVRAEIRRPGHRPRPQDTDDENESVWRRLAASLGWLPAEERAADVLDASAEQPREQAA